VIWDMNVGERNFLLAIYSTNESLNQIIGPKYTICCWRYSKNTEHPSIRRTVASWLRRPKPREERLQS
jgi:hypothetical protein